LISLGPYFSTIVGMDRVRYAANMTWNCDFEYLNKKMMLRR
jgi:hypothetical protein